MVSAKNNNGEDRLLELIDQILLSKEQTRKIIIPLIDGKLLSWLYRHAQIVTDQIIEEDKRELQILISTDNLNKFSYLSSEHNNVIIKK